MIAVRRHRPRDEPLQHLLTAPGPAGRAAGPRSAGPSAASGVVPAARQLWSGCEQPVGEGEEVVPGGDVRERGSVAAPLPVRTSAGRTPTRRRGLDVAIRVHDEPRLGRLERPRGARLLDQASSGLSACASRFRGYEGRHRSHPACSRAATVELDVDRVQRVEIEQPAPDDRLVRDDEQPVARRRTAPRSLRPRRGLTSRSSTDFTESVRSTLSTPSRSRRTTRLLTSSTAQRPSRESSWTFQQAIDDHRRS